MRIVFVNATKSWGGIKTWMLDLAEFLVARGHDALVVCRKGDRFEQIAKDRGLNVRTTNFGPDYSIVAIVQFIQMFRRFQAQIVITNTSKEVRTAGVAAAILGVKHVNRLGSYGDVKNRMKTRCDYRLLVDEVIVCSHSLECALKEHDWLRSKIRVFHNGSKFSQPKPKEIGSEGVRFAIVAILSARKQVDRVIEAFSRLEETNWSLHIGGVGPEGEALKKQVAEYGLEDRIKFYGMVEAGKFLADKHVGILYSREEAFGTSLLEYMASGCCVVASKVGGILEVFSNQKEKIGYLVDPHYVDDLKQCLKGIILEPEKVRSMGSAAFAHGNENFSTSKSFARIEKFFETIKQVT